MARKGTRSREHLHVAVETESESSAKINKVAVSDLALKLSRRISDAKSREAKEFACLNGKLRSRQRFFPEVLDKRERRPNGECTQDKE